MASALAYINCLEKLKGDYRETFRFIPETADLIKDLRQAGFEPAHPKIVSERFYPRMGLY